MTSPKDNKINDFLGKYKDRKGEPLKTEKLKKEGKTTNGGRRPGSGRKPKLENMIERGHHTVIDQFFNEDVEMTVVDKKTGKEVKIKKPRMRVIFEKLYMIGMKEGGSHEALAKLLDRALGKPLQPMEHRGDKTKPIHISIDI